MCDRTLLIDQRQIAFGETGSVLARERVEAAFASHVMVIDGHTLGTTEHHEAERVERHQHLVQAEDGLDRRDAR